MKQTDNYRLNLPNEEDLVNINDLNENFGIIDTELKNLKDNEITDLTSDKVTKMTGYSKGTSSSAISTSDSLNTAVGKLEYQLGQKASTSHNQASNTITAMTGYSKGTSSSAISTSDSLNTAVGKLEYQLGQKASTSHNQASNTITAMTGYSKGTSSSAISTSDSLNTAIGKLEYGKVDGRASTLRAGSSSVASGSYSTALGYQNTASGSYSTALGYSNTASGNASIALGFQNRAIESFSTALGYQSIASGKASTSLGYSNTASGSYSTALGYQNRVSDSYSMALGSNNIASGSYSTALGYQNTANGYYSTALGRYNTSNYQYETVIGRFNKIVDNVTTTTGDIFTIGNGTLDTSRSNAFRIINNGTVYAGGSYNSTGADFAEYFEWEDGNPNNEDRIGYFVKLVGDKIKIADENDDILGIISGTASVIGNTQEDDWCGRYVYDEWGRLQYEDVTIPAEYETIINEETGEEEQVLIMEEQTINTMKINPDYDASVEYIPRSERKEWGVVGLLGQIFVRDDGTCQVGGYCKCGSGGIATKANSKENAYKVMKRVNENIVSILYR